MIDAASIFEAVKGGDEAAVARLLAADPALVSARDEAGRSPVLIATYYGRRDLAELIAGRGTALDVHEAAALGRRDRVEELVSADASRARAYAADGATPLHLAVYFGHPELAEWLLDRGADVNAPARPPFPADLRPIHSALAHRNPEVARRSARLLIARGAEVHVKQEGRYTPLHQAAAHGDAEVVELLLAAGADPAATTQAGETPAALAEAKGHGAVARRLRQAEAA